MIDNFSRDLGRAYNWLVFHNRHNSANAVRGALNEIERLRKSEAEALAQVGRLERAMEEEAKKLGVEATYWVPGSTAAGRNPYAGQMHEVLRRSAARLCKARTEAAPSTPNDEAGFKPASRPSTPNDE